MSELEKLKYQAMEEDAYYEVGIDEYNVLYAEKFYFPLPGFSNSYGIGVYINTSAKRARISYEQWSKGWDAWGLGTYGRYIVSKKFMSLDEANQFRQRLLAIENEEDNLEREVLTLQLAQDIIRVAAKGE